MNSLTVVSCTFTNEDKAAVVISTKRSDIEITGSEEILSLSLSTLLLMCLMKGLGRSALGQMVGNILSECFVESLSTIWFSSLVEYAIAIPLLLN